MGEQSPEPVPTGVPRHAALLPPPVCAFRCCILIYYHYLLSLFIIMIYYRLDTLFHPELGLSPSLATPLTRQSGGFASPQSSSRGQTCGRSQGSGCCRSPRYAQTAEKGVRAAPPLPGTPPHHSCPGTNPGGGISTAGGARSLGWTWRDH